MTDRLLPSRDELIKYAKRDELAEAERRLRSNNETRSSLMRGVALVLERERTRSAFLRTGHADIRVRFAQDRAYCPDLHLPRDDVQEQYDAIVLSAYPVDDELLISAARDMSGHFEVSYRWSRIRVVSWRQLNYLLRRNREAVDSRGRPYQDVVFTIKDQYLHSIRQAQAL